MDGNANGSSLSRLVAELRRITDENNDPASVVELARPCLLAAAAARDWLSAEHYDCDGEQGFGVHLLHEEADHALAVLAVAWLPGRGAPPHDHGTWAVIAGVEGDETNTFWARRDDASRPGHAEIAECGQSVVGPGDAVAMLPGEIHSVANETSSVSLSLHVYGKHPNFTERSQFDPESNEEKTFKFKQAG